MGQMCNTASEASELRKQLNSSVKQHKGTGFHRYYTKDKNLGIREIYCISEKHRVNGPRRPEKHDIRSGEKINNKGKDPGKGSSQKVKKQEFAAAHLPLNRLSKKEKTEHVEDDVRYPRMNKHIGHKLPDISPENKGRNHRKIIQAARKYHIYHEYCKINPHQYEGQA